MNDSPSLEPDYSEFRMKSSKRERILTLWSWILIALKLGSMLLGLAVAILWFMDARPVENDYCLADLRSAPQDYESSYPLLLKLAHKGKNHFPDPNAPEVVTNLFVDDPHSGGNPYRDIIEAYPDLKENQYCDHLELGLTQFDIQAIEVLIKCCDFSNGRVDYDTLMQHADKIDLAWEHSAPARFIVDQLNTYKEIADLSTTIFTDQEEANDTPHLEGIGINLRVLGRLYTLKTLLEWHKTNSVAHLAHGFDLYDMCYKLMPNVRSGILKLTLCGVMAQAIETANLLANDESLTDEGLLILRSRIVPLDEPRISWRNQVVFDYIWMRDQLILKDCSTKFNFKKNSTITCLRISYFGPNDMPNASIWPAGIPLGLPSFFEEGDRFKPLSILYMMYNPFGLSASLLGSNSNSVGIFFTKRINDYHALLNIILDVRNGASLSGYLSDTIILKQEPHRLCYQIGTSSNDDREISLPINLKLISLDNQQ